MNGGKFSFNHLYYCKTKIYKKKIENLVNKYMCHATKVMSVVK